MRVIIIVILVLIATACSPLFQVENAVRVEEGTSFHAALLVEGEIYDQGWDSQAYKGLKEIERTMNAKVKVVQYVDNDDKRRSETEALAKEGYQLIFGNGRSFERAFNSLAKKYPNTHFVFFNGQSKETNVSAMNFTPESMGYFSGMVAGLMTKTHKVGLIPAYQSMKEIDSFVKAVKEQNSANQVLIEEVQDWNDGEKAEKIASEMIKSGVDILVPMGDGFNLKVIMEAHHANRLAIGYISNQSFVSKETVITSTVQHVTNLYVEIAKKYQEGTLQGGSLYFDFQDGVQELAPFGPMVPPGVQKKVMLRLAQYKEGKFTLPVVVHK
jgi:transcriptional activator of comK gene